MPSAFSFGFGGDDIEVDDDLDVESDLEGQRETAGQSNLLSARRHDLNELVSHSHKRCCSGIFEIIFKLFSILAYYYLPFAGHICSK